MFVDVYVGLLSAACILGDSTIVSSGLVYVGLAFLGWSVCLSLIFRDMGIVRVGGVVLGFRILGMGCFIGCVL